MQGQRTEHDPTKKTRIRKGSVFAHEKLNTLMLGAFIFSAVFLLVAGRVIRDALFLSMIEASFLSRMYLATAILIPGPALVYAWMGSRIRRDILGNILSILLLLTLVALTPFLFSGAQAAPIALYLWVEISGAILILHGWTMITDLFSSFEGKSLFPRISLGGIVAGIVGGGLAGLSAKHFGIEGALGILAIDLVFFILLNTTIGRNRRATLIQVLFRVRKQKVCASPQNSTRRLQIFWTPHIRVVAAIVGLTAFTMPFIDFHFKVALQELYPTHGNHAEDLAWLLGLLFTGCAMIAALIQLFIATPLSKKLGVAGTLVILPSSFLLGMGMMIGLAPLLLGPAFLTLSWFSASAFANKINENVFRYSIFDTTVQLLYAPLSDIRRGRAKAAIDGVVKPFAIGLSGVVLSLLSLFQMVGPKVLLTIVTLASLSLCTILYRARSSYLSALIASVQKDDLSKRTHPAKVNTFSEDDLFELLKRGTPEARGFLVEILAQNRDMRLPQPIESFAKTHAREIVQQQMQRQKRFHFTKNETPDGTLKSERSRHQSRKVYGTTQLWVALHEEVVLEDDVRRLTDTQTTLDISHLVPILHMLVDPRLAGAATQALHQFNAESLAQVLPKIILRKDERLDIRVRLLNYTFEHLRRTQNRNGQGLSDIELLNLLRTLTTSRSLRLRYEAAILFERLYEESKEGAESTNFLSEGEERIRLEFQPLKRAHDILSTLEVHPKSTDIQNLWVEGKARHMKHLRDHLFTNIRNAKPQPFLKDIMSSLVQDSRRDLQNALEAIAHLLPREDFNRVEASLKLTGRPEHSEREESLPPELRGDVYEGWIVHVLKFGDHWTLLCTLYAYQDAGIELPEALFVELLEHRSPNVRELAWRTMNTFQPNALQDQRTHAMRFESSPRVRAALNAQYP